MAFAMNQRFLTTGICVIFFAVVGCKSLNGTSSHALSDGQTSKDAIAGTTIGNLNAVRTAVNAQIAQTKLEKDPQIARKQVYDLAVKIQEMLVEYSNSVMNQDQLNLMPDFYAMTSPEYRQIFDILDIKVPDRCDPNITSNWDLLHTAEEYLANTSYEAIDPKLNADEMQRNLEERIFSPMEKLVAAYEKDHKKTVQQDYTEKRPRERLTDFVPAIQGEISALESLVSIINDETVRRGAVFQLMVKIQSVFERVSGPGANGVAAAYPNFYEMVSPDINQLFDILGRELPDQCDPNKTPNYTFLRTPEDYLAMHGTYARFGDAATALKAMHTSVDTLAKKMNEQITAYEKTKKR